MLFSTTGQQQLNQQQQQQQQQQEEEEQQQQMMRPISIIWQGMMDFPEVVCLGGGGNLQGKANSYFSSEIDIIHSFLLLPEETDQLSCDHSQGGDHPGVVRIIKYSAT